MLDVITWNARNEAGSCHARRNDVRDRYVFEGAWRGCLLRPPPVAQSHEDRAVLPDHRDIARHEATDVGPIHGLDGNAGDGAPGKELGV